MKILNRLTNMINNHFTQILSMNHKVDILICQIAKYFNQIMKYFIQLSSIISRMNSLIQKNDKYSSQFFFLNFKMNIIIEKLVNISE